MSTAAPVSVKNPASAAARTFSERFGGGGRMFRAPGRINLIGEHTDYSDGFVLPAAIDRDCCVAAAANGGRTLRVIALNHGVEAELSSGFTRRGDWTDYVAGVRAVLQEQGMEVPGCDLVIASSVPEGAGVSSSAALEVSVLLALSAAAGASPTPLQTATWAREAEVRYAGVPCGVMDQFISTHGRAGEALLLDCRTLEFRRLPLPAATALLVIDSGVRHRLADGGFQAVHDDVQAAARGLGVAFLRDATPDMLEASRLEGLPRSRARHIISENLRALAAADALAQADMPRLGALMNASHAGLRDDLRVTCHETDLLAGVAQATPGVLGARQMGGGFGGAVLALVEAAFAEAAAEAVARDYASRTGVRTCAFRVSPSDGAGEIHP